MTEKILLLGDTDRVAIQSELMCAFIKFRTAEWHVMDDSSGFSLQCRVFAKYHKKEITIVKSIDNKWNEYDHMVTCYDGRKLTPTYKYIREALINGVDVINLLCQGYILDKKGNWVPKENPEGTIGK